MQHELRNRHREPLTSPSKDREVADNEIDRSLRFRNYAEELRIIAAEATPAGRKSLLMTAREYDHMADSMDAIVRSKVATGQRAQR